MKVAVFENFVITQIDGDNTHAGTVIVNDITDKNKIKVLQPTIKYLKEIAYHLNMIDVKTEEINTRTWGKLILEELDLRNSNSIKD